MNVSTAIWRISTTRHPHHVDLRTPLTIGRPAFRELQMASSPTRDNEFVATSISAVEASQPERLVSAATEVGARATQLDNLISTQRETVDKLRAGWSGSAANAAIARGEHNLATQEALRDK
jgi:hypothetical protein